MPYEREIPRTISDVLYQSVSWSMNLFISVDENIKDLHLQWAQQVEECKPVRRVLHSHSWACQSTNEDVCLWTTGDDECLFWYSKWVWIRNDPCERESWRSPRSAVSDIAQQYVWQPFFPRGVFLSHIRSIKSNALLSKLNSIPHYFPKYS